MKPNEPVIELTDAPRKRRTRAELEALVLDAGLEVLEQDGLGLRPDSLTYARVFDHIKRSRGVLVTRGSVHERIWDSQHHFQLAVLIRAVEYVPTATYEQAFSGIGPAIEAFTRGDFTAMDAFREAIRVGCLRQQEVVDSSPVIERYDLIRAALRTMEPSPIADALRETVTEALLNRRALLAEQINGLLDALDLQIKPDCGLDRETALTLMTDTLETLDYGSCAYRATSPPGAYQAPALMDANGELQPWNHMGISFWALVQMLVQPA